MSYNFKNKKKMKKELRFLPKYNNFGIEKVELAYEAAPVVTLSDECYKELGLKRPPENAPKVAFLMGQDGDFNTIDKPYAYALTLAGLNIIAVGYVHCEQMNGCHALLLPGGAFISPAQYYMEGDPAAANDETSLRAEAYRKCFHQATLTGIPVLGICAGMQMIFCELGCRMTSNLKDFLGDKVEHKTTAMHAHEVDVIPGTLLHELTRVRKLKVNSRHTEGIVETNNLVTINALAPDGCPEALEVTEDGANIFGVQWHPEDYVMQGDKKHFAIYQWLARKAHETQAFVRATEETITKFT